MLFVLSACVYVGLLTLCIALAKAAALGDRQAELSRLPFRSTDADQDEAA